MKVELELKNGRRKAFNPTVAKVLVARGLACEAMSYQTRELRATDNAKWDAGELGRSEAHAEVDEVETLRVELDKRGIKYHHRAGAAKLRELLEG